TKGGASFDETLQAIRAVQRGQHYVSPEIAQKLAIGNLTGSSSENVFDKLTEREMQVAMMIVNCHKVQEISDRLCLSPKTVNTYRYRIFDKLNIDSDVALTRLAMSHGLVDVAKVV
ncbi:MAG: DNA-binding response regulator, partial [Gammaproteobacteria bacterium]